MEIQPYSQAFRMREGFIPDGPLLEGVPDSVIEGQNSWFYNGRWQSDRGASATGGTGGLLDMQVIAGQHAGCSGPGNLWQAFDHIWTTGNAFVNGASIGGAAGQLQLQVGGTMVPAGLDPPSAPTFEPTTTIGRLQGAFSVVLQAFRNTTGALSSRSAPSATISVQNRKGKVTFPAAPAGATHWIIGGSIRGVPGGPWYRCTNIDPLSIPVGTVSVEVDWLNGELGGLMPINYDKPPTCTHVAALGGVVMALGVGPGGYGVRPSIVAIPEAYPPEYRFDLPVREPITGVQPGVDGVVLVSTLNGLMGLLLSGASGRPVLARVIFGNVGFARQNAWCVVYDQIYGFSSKAGMVRTHGGQEPDSSFAAPVQKFFEANGFNSATAKCIFDQAHDAVLVCNGSLCVPFMRASNRWSAPIILPGSASAGVALNGVGLIQIGGTAYAVDASGGGPLGGWFLRSPYTGLSGDFELNVKTLREFYGGGNSAMTHDLLMPDSGWGSGMSIGGYFPLTLAAPYGALGTRPRKPYRKFRALAYKVSGSAGNQIPNVAIIKGNVLPMA